MSFAATGDDGLVATVDSLASDAGAAILSSGGNAVDAAVAAGAVLTVTTQHMCGIGGDVWALVSEPGKSPTCLNASGRAGSGADAATLRAEGHTHMPPFHDIRAATVPGCVDGWLALMERYGTLDLGTVLEPAIRLAEDGFSPSPLLIEDAPLIASVPGAGAFRISSPDATIRRPELGAALRELAAEGRDAWYMGTFGQGLIRIGDGLFTIDDLQRISAEWVEPLSTEAWGHTIWTAPPNSQGYLTLAASRIASDLDVPADPSDPQWLHYLVEAARVAGYDRNNVLFDEADGEGLLDARELARRRDLIRADRRIDLSESFSDGGTIYLAVVDREGMAVSYINSNANGFGTRVTVPELGVFLHNRAIGFSLEEGHPAEYLPGRRPRHTLSPALVTRSDGSLRTVLGTMGGDSQPQILLQLLARTLLGGQTPAEAISAPRWVLAPSDSMGFDTWEEPAQLAVAFEHEAPAAWDEAAHRGHQVRRARDEHYGHAQMIEIQNGSAHGAADPRSIIGSVSAPSRI